MARCPFAEWRPLGSDVTHQPLMERHDGVVLHTMVGSLSGTDAMFHTDGYVGTESHFGVGYDGTIYQWVDTARTADANLEGNFRLLSIETADTGPGFETWTGSNVPAWRTEQMNALGRLVAWLADTHGFPLTKMPDSRSTSRGVGWHRLGCDSSPAGQPGYRIAGGEHWSTSVGKVCPGDRRIAQVDDVIALAKQGAMPPWPQFRETSPAVGAMVVKLSVNGYFVGKRRDRPNYYGAFTRAAIARLQEAQGWTGAAADGLIGPMTWGLIEALPDQPQDPPPGHSFPDLDPVREALGDVIRAEQAAEVKHPLWHGLASMRARHQVDHAAIVKMQHPEG